ncbi:MAG: lipoyl(octanoyl) transferase LipB [Bdellovibrionaceae bacterium]|nr:lipoyl(octanoyl) transferase LipB [Pseudobdellovibrionaceae bacterium]
MSADQDPNQTQGIKIIDWGLISYQDAFERQKAIVDEILLGHAPEQIIFCTHPPVVTLGRGTMDGDIFNWTGETASVNRGGRATYHGPSQLIMYPLIYLGKTQSRFLPKVMPENDLHAYMRSLEQSVVEVLGAFQVVAQARPLKKQVGETDEKEATGVWVDDKKIAAIGIAVKAWITSHGIALNLHHDPSAFQGINPCGFRGDQVTSIEDVLQKKINRSDVFSLWKKTIVKNLFRGQQ